MKLFPSLLGLVLLAGLAWAVLWGLTPCRPLDRLFGLSGCAASHQIAKLGSLRRTVAFDPGMPSRLVVAGSEYRQQYAGSDGLRASSRIVLYDLEAGREIARYRVQPNGILEQLALSPDGGGAALTCNRLHFCDFAPGHLPEGLDRDAAVPISFVDLAGSSPEDGDRLILGDATSGWWLRALPEIEAPANADGTAVELRFSADGKVILADSHAWTAEDGTPVPHPPEELAPPPQSFDRLTTAAGGTITFDRKAGLLRIAGPDAASSVRQLPLELPEGFIPELHLPLAASPDGRLLAALSRRFAGEGRPRALLQVWRIADGKRLRRIAFEEDLFVPLVWAPDGRSVLVALASRPAAGGGTEIRLYGVTEDEAE